MFYNFLHYLSFVSPFISPNTENIQFTIIYKLQSSQSSTMLILIAGITGNIGQQAAKAGLERGHEIRGLGRSPHKIDSTILSSLESFVQSKTYYDVPALEQAVKGVDAVICAYAGLPELALDGQLLLLRAAERAGVKVSDHGRPHVRRQDAVDFLTRRYAALALPSCLLEL